MFRKIVRYQGSRELQGLEPRDRDRVQRNVKSIQTMAETLYKKIQVKQILILYTVQCTLGCLKK